LQFAIDAVADDDYKLIKGEVDRGHAAKVSGKVVKKSVYKGVSLNGRKWQVSRF
jgi:hypothetical protein